MGRAIATIFNAVIEAINRRPRLPRFLVITPDKDTLNDIDVYEDNVKKIIRDNVFWLIRQVDLILRRRKIELMDKKPGTIFSGDPKVILIRMIRRPEFKKGLKPTRLEEVCILRPKFNDALNEAAMKYNFNILTINSCTTSDHFDQLGSLSNKGKIAFWHELDDLLERFDKRIIHLKPNPLNHPSAPVSSKVVKKHTYCK